MNTTLTAIIAQIKSNNEEINEIQATRDEIIFGSSDGIGKNYKKYDELTQHEELLTLRNKFLKTNALHIAIETALTAFVGIWNKYTGKHYGPATEKKISEELKKACNFSVYVRKPFYTAEINFCMINPETGYNHNFFNYKDLVVYGYNENILENNVIQEIRPAFVERVVNKTAYFEDIDTAIYNLVKVSAEIEKLSKQAKNLVNDFNGCTPYDYKSATAHFENIYNGYKLTGSSELESIIAKKYIEVAEAAQAEKLA